MTTKLTPTEVEKLYNALPTEAAYQKIKDGHNNLEKIYGDFILNTLGYPNIDKALQEGVWIVQGMDKNADDFYPSELLQEVILKHMDE